MGKIIDKIKSINKEKKEAGKGLEISSTRENRIRDLERKYERGDMEKEEVMFNLEKEFSYHLDRDDYEEIKKAIR